MEQRKSIWPFGNKTADISKMQPRRPGNRDMTGGMVANAETLRGLYDGTIDSLQFASPYAYAPIAVPVSLMGIPTPVPIEDDEQTELAVKEIIDAMADDIQSIHRTEYIQGTAWRWARWDGKRNRLVWESIPDETITDMEIDLISGEIVAIYTHDRFKVTLAENQIGFAERKRKITQKQIDVKWVTKAGKASSLQDSSMRNPFGFMPVPFGHDCEDGKYRGRSVYSRILRLMKATHEIQLNREQTLATFKAKLVIGTKDPKSWLENNGYGESIQKAIDDVYTSSLYIANKDDGGIDMLHLPSDATKQHTDAMSDNRKMMIQGSGVPELFWGGLATGNHASTDSQRDLCIAYINSLRQENNRAYDVLFNQSLTILGYVRMKQYKQVRITWDAFDMVSAETRAKIFQSVASGAASLVSGAAGTKEDIWHILRGFYPSLPETTPEDFIKGLTAMALHKALSGASALDAMDLSGGNTPEEPAK